MKKNVFKFFLISSFIFFVIFLFWIILFKYISPLELFSRDRFIYRRVSMVPFSDFAKGYYSKLAIWGNILLFIPVGVYLSVFKKNLKIYQKIIILPFISLFFEIAQYIFLIGATDATDIVTNTLGGTLGILFYHLLNKIFKGNHTADYVFWTTWH